MDRDKQKPSAGESFEDYPLTRQEYISVMVHFYRGESHRAMVWRQRLDRTTNWAVLTMAGVLSFSFADVEHESIILPLSTLMLLTFLIIEARRFRYFEVYRARVRMLEENFLLPILSRRLESPNEAWRTRVAMDLDRPKFKTTMLEAIGLRLRQNYLFIFTVLAGGWIVKLILHPTHTRSWSDLLSRIAFGPILPGVVLGLMGTFYLALVVISLRAHSVHGRNPLDEVCGVEEDLEQWKI